MDRRPSAVLNAAFYRTYAIEDRAS